MTRETIFTNARLVLEDQVVEGTLVLRDGTIADIDTGGSGQGADMEGDYILPGLVELHTDHLEAHYSPRPGVRWHMLAAIQAHDAQIAASGITTVFDCLRMGSDSGDAYEVGEMRAMADALVLAGREGRLRADHKIHLRCEVSSPGVMEQFRQFDDLHHVALASLMDHAPGQRQFQTMDQYTLYYKTKRGLSDEEFRAFVEKRQRESRDYSDLHRSQIAQTCKARGIAIASHDDATLDHVDEAKANGVKVAEFPTSFEAATASHEAGMSVLMGAPNVVRGKSHSGNIAARDLAQNGVLDILSSDYVPFSLIQAPFVLADEVDGISLPEAISMVTATPARTVGLEDRGRLEPGLRGDVIRVRRDTGVPVVREVWREGGRVA